MNNLDPIPKKSSTRWIVLIMVCISSLGSYYCIDNIGALYEPLKNQFSCLGSSYFFYFNLLYSVYSIPNIILPFFGGLFIIRFGERTMYILLACFVIIGQFIVAMGGSTSSIYLMLLGRIVFGLGGESLNIAQNAMIIKWFNKGEISWAFALKISFSRIGSSLNGILSPRIAAIDDSSKALWAGLIVCVISLIAIIICCIIDWNEDKKNQLIKKQETISVNICESLKLMSIVFCVITILNSLLYGIIMPFNNIASGFYVETWFKNIPKQEAIKKAGIAMGFPFFVSIILVPVFSLFVVKNDKKEYILLVSTIFSLLAFSMFYFFTPIYSIICLGICYSLFATVLTPLIQLVVPNKKGLAYGVTASIQNLILVVFPIIVDYIFSSLGENYYKTLYFFIILSSITIINSAIFIYLYKINSNEIESYKKIDEKKQIQTLDKDQEKSNDIIYEDSNNNVTTDQLINN